MQIIITGGGGFLGQKLASALLNSSLAFNELLLVDLTNACTVIRFPSFTLSGG